MEPICVLFQQNTLGLTPRILNTNFDFIGLYKAKFYGKPISRRILKKFSHLVSEISIPKMLKLVKITENFCFASEINPKWCILFKIWSKIPGFLYPDFSRIFRIRFFSRKKKCGRLREVKLSAILCHIPIYFIFNMNLFGGRSWQTWKMQKTIFI